MLVVGLYMYGLARACAPLFFQYFGSCRKSNFCWDDSSWVTSGLDPRFLGNVWESDCIIGKDCARRNWNWWIVLLLFHVLNISFSYSPFSGLESLSPSSEEHQPQQQAQSHRGVKPVYLRCSQGSVSWLYPRGALRVVLRYGTAGKEFQVRKRKTTQFP